MPNHKKESELYPAIGKAVFVDQDAFFKWYLEEGGYGWLNPGVSYQSRMSGREKLFESMVPGYWDFYRCFSGDSAMDKAAIIRKINTYRHRIIISIGKTGSNVFPQPIDSNHQLRFIMYLVREIGNKKRLAIL